MAKINKCDFYYGSFLTYLISNGAKEPVMFDDAGGNSKIVRFGIKDKNYNAYLKYVGNSVGTRNKNSTRWDFTFTDKEHQSLINDFEIDGFENIVVLICANAGLKNTNIGILTYNQAMQCLGLDDVNDQRRISIVHKKGSKYIGCYGTKVCSENMIQRKFDFDEYFNFK